jgi:4-hydroxybenzoate polyprenyltransferase
MRLRQLSRRLLAAVQFTRFAMVFTAVSNAQAALLLLAERYRLPDQTLSDAVRTPQMIVMAVLSIGLYGFGMCLNDLVDRRRDASMAADRPLPSGRLGLATARLLCVAMLALACGSAIAYVPFSLNGVLSIILTAGVISLILFFDLAGKYIVPLGLVTLGLIRVFHVAIATPSFSIVWHPLILMNHVILVSTLTYWLEDKRPTLTRKHVRFVVLITLALDLALLALLLWRRGDYTLYQMGLNSELLPPAGAVIAFAGVAWGIVAWARDRRTAGRRLTQVGLLWLIIYDATFVASSVSWKAALCLLSLVPLAWIAVKICELLARLGDMSARPQYIRAR